MMKKHIKRAKKLYRNHLTLALLAMFLLIYADIMARAHGVPGLTEDLIKPFAWLLIMFISTAVICKVAANMMEAWDRDRNSCARTEGRKNA